MDSIRKWLSGTKDYGLGVALYHAHGRNEALKKVFAQGHSAYRQKKLEGALNGLLPHSEVVQIEVPGKADVVPVIVTHSEMPEHSVPADKDPYREKWMPLFMERNLLRHKLRDAPNDEERGRMAFRILDLQDACQKWWDKRDYFLRTGSEMPDETPIALVRVTADVNEKMKRLTTVRTYIVRYENKLKKDEYNTSVMALLGKYTQERDLLEKELGYKRDKHGCRRINHINNE